MVVTYCSKHTTLICKYDTVKTLTVITMDEGSENVIDVREDSVIVKTKDNGIYKAKIKTDKGDIISVSVRYDNGSFTYEDDSKMKKALTVK